MSYFSDSFDEEVTRLLQGGAVGFIPSDTIYGLSCRALDERAVERLRKIKGRAQNKPFIILISNLKMLDLLSISEREVLMAKKYWPGALTLICQAPQAPGWLRLNGQTLAIRMPASKNLQTLIENTGPIISTSANKAGKKLLSSVSAAQAEFGDKLDFYVDKGTINQTPSTIIRVAFSKVEVLRDGAVKIKETK